MPIIEEQDLLDLKNKVESLQTSNIDLKIELEEKEKATESTAKQRNIIGAIAGLLFLTALAFLFLWLTKDKVKNQNTFLNEGEFVVNQSKLDSIVNDRIAIHANDNYDELTNDSSAGSIKDELIYAVQVAAFTDNNISLTSDDLAQFQEVKKGKFYKYSLGAFSTLEEAQQFRKDLVRLGFEDAFIGSYQNGKRVRIEEAY